MKRVALAAGLSTPVWAFAYAAADVQEAVRLGGLDFPMLVKHHNSYSSIGFTQPSTLNPQP